MSRLDPNIALQTRKIEVPSLLEARERFQAVRQRMRAGRLQDLQLAGEALDGCQQRLAAGQQAGHIAGGGLV